MRSFCATWLLIASFDRSFKIRHAMKSGDLIAHASGRQAPRSVPLVSWWASYRGADARGMPAAVRLGLCLEPSQLMGGVYLALAAAALAEPLGSVHLASLLWLLTSL